MIFKVVFIWVSHVSIVLVNGVRRNMRQQVQFYPRSALISSLIRLNTNY